MIDNIVIISDGQKRDSAIYTHVSILPQSPLPSRLPHIIEWNSFGLYSRSLLVIHFNYSSVALFSNHPFISFYQRSSSLHKAYSYC